MAKLFKKSPTKASATAGASVIRCTHVVWQWEGNYADHYHDFDDQCQRLLEKAYTKGKVSCKLPVHVLLPGHEVNVQELYMVDEVTRLRRSLLRLVEPDRPDGKACWQWNGDAPGGNVWVLFDGLCSGTLEAAFRAGAAQVDLELVNPRLPYVVDISNRCQTNKRTRFVRKVRRLTALLPPSSMRSQAASGSSASGGSHFSLDQSAAMVTGSHVNASSQLVKGIGKFVEIVHNPDAQDTCPICMEALTSPSAYADPPAHSSAADAPVATKSIAPRPSSTGSGRLAHTSAKAGASSLGTSAGGRGGGTATNGLVSQQQLPPQLSAAEASCVVQFKSCKHQLHRLCLATLVNSTATGARQQAGGGAEAMAATSITCPSCNKVYGEKTGTCPNGMMNSRVLPHHRLPGHDQHGVIEITYDIQPGLQGPEHPHPGKPYFTTGFPRVAYLPDSDKGRLVLELLRVAFARRLTFTVGVSVTTGASDTVTWNEIHHKTQVTGAHGYPDDSYLDRVIDELEAFGISESDLATHK